jgi:hypothetical protein
MTVTFNLSLLQPIVALIAGVLIFLIPRILSDIHRRDGIMASPSIRLSALNG